MIWIGAVYVLGAGVVSWLTAKVCEARFWGVVGALTIGLLWPLYLSVRLLDWCFGEILRAARGL